MGTLAYSELEDSVLHFDEKVKAGMTVDDQIKVITACHELFNRPKSYLGNGNSFYDMQPLEILLATSTRIWQLYDPQTIAKMPYTQAALLAYAGAHCEETPHIYTRILDVSDILSAEIRALFCVSRMMKCYGWTQTHRFFAQKFKLMTLQSFANGIPAPVYPPAFCRKNFYKNYSPSYGSKLPSALREAVAFDDPSRFGIALTMCNKQLSKNLLLYLIDESAKNILSKNINAIKQHLSFEEVVLYCASSLNPDIAVPLLDAIESAASGTIKNTVDIFGNNALWYLFYRTGHFGQALGDAEPIRTALLAAGCDPLQMNCLDLNYAAMEKAHRSLQQLAHS